MALHFSHAQALAERLDTAAAESRLVPMISQELEISVEEAYEIQEISLNRRRDRGEALVGMKMGLTSLAKMRQMGVHSPIFGFLTDTMVESDGALIDMRRLTQPRVEPEIAFILGTELRGPTTAAHAMLAVRGVCAALEILDSRFADFKFNLADVVADNASSAKFVLGSGVRPPDAIDTACLGMVMAINGKVVEVGSSAAVFEHPARSLAKLANMLAAHGKGLEAGQIVLTGGVTAAVAIAPGDWVRLEVEDLGTVSFRCGAAKELPVAQGSGRAEAAQGL
jgi:2-oxo-3-hexenedioate decarboxylase